MTSSGPVRSAGLHALLGTIPEGHLARPIPDGQDPIPTRAGADQGLVPGQPASSSPRAAAGTYAKATRPLRLLRRHLQPRCPRGISAPGDPNLAPVALAAFAASAHLMGEVQGTAQALPASPSADRALVQTYRSEGLIRGAGCVNRACPDLWGAWEATPRPTRPLCRSCSSSRHRGYRRHPAHTWPTPRRTIGECRPSPGSSGVKTGRRRRHGMGPSRTRTEGAECRGA